MNAVAIDPKIKQLFPVLLMAGLIAFNLFAIILPYLTQNTVQEWDAVGHYESALTTREFFPDFSGWNNHAFLGFAQNYFYPPFFYYLAAIISFFIPMIWAIKWIVAISLFLLPISMYYLAQKFDFSRNRSAVFALISYAVFMIPSRLFDSGTIGSNLDSVLIVGLLPNALALPILFFGLGKMKEEINNQQSVWSALLVAVVILTHYIGFILPIIGVGLLVIKPNRKKTIHYLKIVTVGLFLSLFWLAPFFIFSLNQFSNLFLPKLTPLLLSITCLGFMLVTHSINQQKIKEEFFIFGLLCAMVFVGLALSIEVHLYRLIPFMLIFFVLMILRMAEKRTTIVLGLLSIILIIWAYPQLYFGNYQTELESHQIMNQKTIIAINKIESVSNFHPIYYNFEINQNEKVVNGLFVESSLNSRFISNITRGISPNQETWGDYTQDELYKLLTNEQRLKLVQNQLQLFGIEQVITDLPDWNGGKRSKPIVWRVTNYRSNQTITFDKNLYQYQLEKTSQTQTISKPIIFFPSNKRDWITATSYHFFDVNQFDSVIVQAIPQKWNLAKGDEKVKWIETNNQSFTIQIESNQPIPVLIKKSYFPNWHAYQDKKEIPIYRASPNLMIIYATGKVNINFEKSPIEKLAIMISLFTIAILLMRKGKL